jgi:hypothetical protein
VLAIEHCAACYFAEWFCTHRSILVLKWDTQIAHRVGCHSQTIENVVEDDNAPFLLLVLGESILCVDQSHLLQNGRFSTLSSTCESSSLAVQVQLNSVVGCDMLVRWGVQSSLPNRSSFTTRVSCFSSRWMRASISLLFFASGSSLPPKHIMNWCAVKVGLERSVACATRQCCRRERENMWMGWDFSRCWWRSAVQVSELGGIFLGCGMKGDLG